MAQIAPGAQIASTALNYCRLGASDAQLAEFFGVSPETLGGWLANSPELAAAVRRGRKMADAEVVDGLHRLATGWVETVEKVMTGRDGPKVVTYRKEHAPHYRAGMTWLCNRLPQNWQWPGARRKQADEIAAQAVDLFALPLLVDEEAGAAPVPAPEEADAPSDITLPEVALPEVAPADVALPDVARLGLPPPLRRLLADARGDRSTARQELG